MTNMSIKSSEANRIGQISQTQHQILIQLPLKKGACFRLFIPELQGKDILFTPELQGKDILFIPELQGKDILPVFKSVFHARTSSPDQS